MPSTDALTQAEPDISVEKPEKVLPLPPADKPAEQVKNLDHIEEATAAKQFLAKQEVAKDLISESTCAPKDIQMTIKREFIGNSLSQEAGKMDKNQISAVSLT